MTKNQAQIVTALQQGARVELSKMMGTYGKTFVYQDGIKFQVSTRTCESLLKKGILKVDEVTNLFTSFSLRGE